MGANVIPGRNVSSMKFSLSLIARRGLQTHSIFRLALEGDTELEELDDDVSELIEEDLIILGVTFDVFLEFFVFDQGHVGGEHHEGLGGDVLVLLGTVPLSYTLIACSMVCFTQRVKVI